MSWREQMLPASFRGVPFSVEYTEDVFGRRAAVTPFPMSDQADVKDMGGQAKSYRFAAYVLGDDYMAQRDALRDALNAAGPGRLVHPYYGEIDVQIAQASCLETVREAGMCRFSIECYLAGQARANPRVSVDTRVRVELSAEQLDAVIAETAGVQIDVSESPNFVLEDATRIVELAAQRVSDLSRQILSAPDAAGELARALYGLAGSAGTLILTPAVLAGEIASALRLVVAAAETPRAAFELLMELTGFRDDEPAAPSTTPNRQRQAENQVGLVQLVRQVAYSQACVASAQMEYSSYDDARDVRDRLMSVADELTEADIDDAVYSALTGLRAVVAQDIGTRGADLARLVKLQLFDSVPALTLAWSLYGDATRADELVTRNALRDPFFVPAGVQLEVLDA
ncbi:DNA circularization protein [Hydrocarboniphaga effusa]|uniref:DNA circularization protein n=1 Tax=Hydrocarboniphaga effusa TaxID=243629 RepID=UPI003BAD17A8